MKLCASDVERVLDAAEKNSIGIIGDMCLDRYIIGNMEGISREAPIPIVRIESDSYLPGGAGNTTLNARGLGMTVHPLGVIGEDLSSDIIFREFRARGISDASMIREPGRHTIAYSKVYASSFHGRIQQVARFDRENAEPITAQSEARVLENLSALLPNIDVLIVADYAQPEGSGTITSKVLAEIENAARSGRMLIIGDSRSRVAAMAHYSAVVPNDTEVAMALYPDDFQRRPYQDDVRAAEYAAALRTRIEAGHVIMTRGEKGAIIASEGGVADVATTPIAGEIDVTGAGDCFAATLAAAMAARLDMTAAVELANLAAGITVKKLNTTGIATPDEIRQSYADQHRRKRS